MPPRSLWRMLTRRSRSGRKLMSTTAEWLTSLGMPEYAARFAENDIDFTILDDLTDQDLEKIGVASLGHRRKLLRAMVDLKDLEKSEPNAAVASVVPAGPRPQDTAERRQVTVMFSEVFTPEKFVISRASRFRSGEKRSALSSISAIVPKYALNFRTSGITEMATQARSAWHRRPRLCTSAPFFLTRVRTCIGQGLSRFDPARGTPALNEGRVSAR
jgi:hypothetical protein